VLYSRRSLCLCVRKIIDACLRATTAKTSEMDGTGGSVGGGGGGLLSSPADLFTRGGQDSSASAQRQSPWSVGHSPRMTDPQPGGGDRSDSAGGGGASTGAVSVAGFSPRVGDGPGFPASRTASSCYGGPDVDTSPPRLAPVNDYHQPSSGKLAFHDPDTDTDTDTDSPNTATILRPTHAVSSRGPRDETAFVAT